MIQDINKFFNNHYEACTPSADDFVICVQGDAILVDCNNDEIRFPTVREVQTVGQYLFTVGDDRYFAGISQAFDNFVYTNPRTAANAANRDKAFAAVTGFHLLNWYRDNRFCGRCGKEMHHSTTERAMVCDCGYIIYPKICPAVIVAVVHDGKLCLTKYNRGYAQWALVAGYTEIGETVEQTVHREVMEEVGLKVKNLRYYKSQPWGRTSSLLFGFFCEVDGDATLTVDENELKVAQWFTPDEIDFEDDGISLTREMIGIFKSGKYKEI